MSRLSLIITDVTDDEIAAIRSIIEGGGAVDEAPAPKPEKGKKSKKSKAEPEPEDDTADAPVTYTDKALGKMERPELVAICETLGIEHKSKRVPTLIELITEKQAELAGGGSSEEEFEDDPDDWDEDVPPADEDEPKPAKKKGGKKGKKKK